MTVRRVVTFFLVLGVTAIGVALAIPNTIQARKHGNETAAIGALKTIATSQSIFREGDKDGNGNLEYGGIPTTGDRYFCTNHSGAIFYRGLTENPWRDLEDGARLSTFSVDVDTASYTTVRQYLKRSTLPPPSSVRVEEILNAFDYDYAPPPRSATAPFAVHFEAAACPWTPEHRLVRIGLKGREVARDARPATSLVFLIDVSGSMQAENRLPLVQQSLRLLVDQLGERDRVAIAVYAGASGLVLPPTPGTRRRELLGAIDRLEAGGSTNGSAGIQLAYEVAASAFIEGGTNRVILCTDGDWNVGVTATTELTDLIARRAKSGVFLSVLGFGMGQRDEMLVQLADRGNGFYGYIDTLDEARRLFVEKLSGTLTTIAKDVKVQVDWNPARVESYRLVGYEKRALAARDFADDAKDAGEIGAGHTVTALYEVAAITTGAGALGTLSLRWKQPDGAKSDLLTKSLEDAGGSFADASRDLRFAASAAAFGMLLRRSERAGSATFGWVAETAAGAAGPDPRRLELVGLARTAAELAAAEGLGRAAAPVAAPAPTAPISTTATGLEALAQAQLIDSTLASGTKQGYSFRVYKRDEFRWMAIASPVVPEVTGQRWFVTNHAGALFYANGPIEPNADCAIPPGVFPVGK